MDAPYWTLLPFVVTVFLASLTGAIFRPGAWYKALSKPGWTPPDIVFPIVWSTLYIAMAIAAWRVWDLAGWHPALAIWALQLGLNALWSAVFFGMRKPGLALAEVILLWLAVAANLYAFAGIDAIAGWLLAPYLVWVTIAATLNLEIVRLNRTKA